MEFPWGRGAESFGVLPGVRASRGHRFQLPKKATAPDEATRADAGEHGPDVLGGPVASSGILVGLGNAIRYATTPYDAVQGNAIQYDAMPVRMPLSPP